MATTAREGRLSHPPFGHKPEKEEKMKYTEAQIETIQKYESLSTNLAEIEDSMQGKRSFRCLRETTWNTPWTFDLGERDDIQMEYLEILRGS